MHGARRVLAGCLQVSTDLIFVIWPAFIMFPIPYIRKKTAGIKDAGKDAGIGSRRIKTPGKKGGGE